MDRFRMLLLVLSLYQQTDPVRHATQAPVGEYRLVYFSASWCGPCQQTKIHFKTKDFERALKKHNIAKVYTVDTDTMPGSVKDYEVTSVPTAFLVRTRADGKVDIVKKNTGMMSKDQLVKFLDPNKTD